MMQEPKQHLGAKMLNQNKMRIIDTPNPFCHIPKSSKNQPYFPQTTE